jgi:MFS transporter, ACS family, hexuronate transporter
MVAALLLAGGVINYIDRASFPVLMPAIRADLGLSEKDYSVILSCFLAAYAVMNGVMGRIVDRLGTRTSQALFTALYSIGQAAQSLVGGGYMLAGCRILVGSTEAGNTPCAVKVIREWFPIEERGTGMALANLGTMIGAVVAPPLAGFLAVRFGWRAAFRVVSALGFCWLALWLLLYRTPHSAEPQAAPAETEVRSWLTVVRGRPCLVLMLLRFLTDPVGLFVIFWLPAYLVRERAFTLALVARYAWWPYAFGAAGYLLGGWFSGFLIRRGWELGKARKFAMAIGAGFVPAAMATTFVGSAHVAIALLCVVYFGHCFWAANVLTLVTDLFGSQAVGTAAGLCGMSGTAGAVLATLIIGRVLAAHPYRGIFLTAGCMHLIALAVLLTLLPERLFPLRPHATRRTQMA